MTPAVQEAEHRVDFDQSVLQALAPYETVQSWPAGQVLFREGEMPAGVHVLLSGEVDLVFTSRTGQTRPLRIAVAGQILGLSSLVSGRAHEYTATGWTTTVTGFIATERLLDVLNEHPHLWFCILQILSSDIKSCYDRMKALAELHPAHGNAGARGQSAQGRAQSAGRG